MSLGAPEILIILLIVLIIFGGSQLPKVARSMGSAHKEFKTGLEGDDSDDQKDEKKSDTK